VAPLPSAHERLRFAWSLRTDLVIAAVAFSIALLLLIAWHPWSVTSAGAASSTCGVVVTTAVGVVHADATGTDAVEWCRGETSRVRNAGLEQAAVTTPLCDFYIGAVHVTVAGTDEAAEQALCTSSGADTSSGGAS
jgi:hypothetical protein